MFLDTVLESLHIVIYVIFQNCSIDFAPVTEFLIYYFSTTNVRLLERDYTDLLFPLQKLLQNIHFRTPGMENGIQFDRLNPNSNKAQFGKIFVSMSEIFPHQGELGLNKDQRWPGGKQKHHSKPQLWLGSGLGLVCAGMEKTEVLISMWTANATHKPVLNAAQTGTRTFPGLHQELKERGHASKCTFINIFANLWWWGRLQLTFQANQDGCY